MEKTGNPLFGFGFTLYEEIVKEVNSLKIKKVSQKADIPVRIVKENWNGESIVQFDRTA